MSEFEQPDDASAHWPDEKSKSSVKRELDALKELGRTLTRLPAAELDRLALPENLQEAVVAARSMSKGALKRQIGFIGGLIAKLDHETIRQDLERLRQPHQGEVRTFHQLENWRDRLVDGEDAVYDELIARFAGFDVQHVRQMVRNARREASQGKPPRSARQLFQYLQECQRAQ